MKTGSSLATGWRTCPTTPCVFSIPRSRPDGGRSAASHRRSDRNAGRPRRPGGSDRSIRGARVWPPMIHHTSREATFVFDFPAAAGNGQKESSINASGTTSMFREDFPQLVRTVIILIGRPWFRMSTVKCRTRMKPIAAPNARGRTSQLLDFRRASRGQREDIGVPTNFNAIVGNHLTVLVQLRFAPKGFENKRSGKLKAVLTTRRPVHSAGRKSRGIWRFEGNSIIEECTTAHYVTTQRTPKRHPL